MKEQKKQLISEWLDKFVESIEVAKSNSIAHLEQFKKDNNLFSEDKLNRWLVDDEFPEWMWFTDGNGLSHGIGAFGKYFYYEDREYIPKESDRIATESEVQERLTKLALKLGYGERQSECLFMDSKRHKVGEPVGVEFNFDIKTNRLWVVFKNGNNNLIFKNGIWAKFIPTEREKIEAQIKELQIKLDALK